MTDYYRIRSPLSQISDERMDLFLRSLEKETGDRLRQVDLDGYLSSDFALLYVATGGSEGYFLEIFERIKERSCYILTSGESNSLAASMEILSYINGHGGRGRILHGDVRGVAEQIRSLRAAHTALSRLRGKRLGCIGEPSDWLISSAYDAKAVESKLGLGFVRVPMEELLGEIEKHVYAENEYTEAFMASGFERDEIRKALYIYGAFQRIVSSYGLCGVTVRCFDLLGTVRSTGCLGLSVLNGLGIYGGCEGDMPSLLSMAVAGSVTGEDQFMCNPSRFDTAGGYATFAHCTLPVTMPDRYALDTHFESGIGVALRGSFDPGECTVFKCSGDLSRHFVAEGRIVETPYSDMLCRTQVKVALGDFSYFLRRPIGNHHILCRGSHAAELETFFDLVAD